MSLLRTRIIPPGVYYDEASIGRVIVAKSMRGGVLGRAYAALEETLYSLGYTGPIKIMAQSYLLNWYESQGYVGEGKDFLERYPSSYYDKSAVILKARSSLQENSE